MPGQFEVRAEGDALPSQALVTVADLLANRAQTRPLSRCSAVPWNSTYRILH